MRIGGCSSSCCCGCLGACDTVAELIFNVDTLKQVHVQLNSSGRLAVPPLLWCKSGVPTYWDKLRVSWLLWQLCWVAFIEEFLQTRCIFAWPTTMSRANLDMPMSFLHMAPFPCLDSLESKNRSAPALTNSSDYCALRPDTVYKTQGMRFQCIVSFHWIFKNSRGYSSIGCL